MGQVLRIRSRFARILGASMVLLAVLGVVSTALGGIDPLLRYGAPVALFGVLGWAAFWQPYVEVSDGGVVLANTLRTTEVWWPMIQEVDGRYGLTLRTAQGSLNAWAAPAPAGRRRARDGSSPTAEEVKRRLQAMRDAGHLDQPSTELPAPRSTWHVGLIAVLVTLVVATATLPLLA